MKTAKSGKWMQKPQVFELKIIDYRLEIGPDRARTDNLLHAMQML